MPQPQIIKFNENLIDIPSVLKILIKGWEELNCKQLRIFNTRSKRTVYSMNKGRTKFLFRDPQHIECLTREEAVKVLNRINYRLVNSNNLAYEVTEE